MAYSITQRQKTTGPIAFICTRGAGALEFVVKALTGVVIFYHQHLFCDALRSLYTAQAVDGKRAVALSIGNAAVEVGATGVGCVVADPVAELPDVGRICRALCRVCSKRSALVLQFLHLLYSSILTCVFCGI